LSHTATTAPTAYTELVKELKRLDTLESCMSLLGWDEQVNLPPGSAEHRARQMAELSDLLHREATHARIGRWLDELGSADLSDEQAVVVAEARKDYERRTRLPAEFVARKAAAESHGYHAWVAARAKDDFSTFLPHLQQNLELAREEAALLDAPDAYNYWIDRFDPGMNRETIEALFKPLRAQLVPLVRQISESGIKADHGIFKGFPVDQQNAFLREVVTAFGFDFNRGRLDIAVHPFCGGHNFDVRMTTRFDVDNPLDSLSSAMHETGHALYEQGLPAEHIGTALGTAVGMAVHESQSRMWENQVGRSRAFWAYWEPRFRAAFPQQLAAVSSDQLYLAINRVEVSPIRVDADEVTYNLHIMLRFELEKRLFDGSLSLSDLPEAWNQLSGEILGYTPKNNREGCLQDVHWSGGAFGYFPSYCLGNILAAQLWYHLREQLPDLDAQIAAGNCRPLLDWLRRHVHALGRRYKTLEFTRRVTGKELSVDSIVRYLKERYLPLYTA